jgi:carbon storage regulator
MGRPKNRVANFGTDFAEGFGPAELCRFDKTLFFSGRIGPMLVLSRKVGERIQIGENITIVVNRVVGNRVTIGIEAPSDVRIVRSELAPLVGQFVQPAPKQAAAMAAPSESLGYERPYSAALAARCAR